MTGPAPRHHSYTRREIRVRLVVRFLGITVLEIEADDGTPPADINEPTEPWPFGFTAGTALAHTEIRPDDFTEVEA